MIGYIELRVFIAIDFYKIEINTIEYSLQRKNDNIPQRNQDLKLNIGNTL